ncbi:hypothetical protein Bbelb_370240 [Branchiostoma belcheri]|nr:hypothetical protein Bbelb_370240 [Branchiostoma belcheri]
MTFLTYASVETVWSGRHVGRLACPVFWSKLAGIDNQYRDSGNNCLFNLDCRYAGCEDMDLGRFFRAVRKGDVQTVRRGLDAGVDVRARRTWLCWYEQTSLHVASWYGKTEVAKLLIEHGADLKARDQDQLTSLHWAAWRGHTGTCELLIRHGADVMARDQRRAKCLAPAERTALSRWTYRTLPQNVSHSPGGRPALSRGKSRTASCTLPQNVPRKSMRISWPVLYQCDLTRCDITSGVLAKASVPIAPVSVGDVAPAVPGRAGIGCRGHN